MKIKKVLAIMVSLALLVGLLIPTSVSAANVNEVSQTLFAGQDIEVGVVTVSQDGDDIRVDYALDYDAEVYGWRITEVHLAVVTEFDDLATNKKGNPEPGHFEFKNEFDPGVVSTGFDVPYPDGATAEDVLYIAAHAVIERVECTTNTSSVIAVTASQTTNKDGTPIAADRSITDNALAQDNTFFSLGFGGYIIFEFDNPILNAPGQDDIRVIEYTGGGGTYPYESVDVFISDDAAAWNLLGTADNGDQAGDTVVDLNLDLGPYASAKYVKVVDTTDINLHSSGADGYDVDAVLAIHENEICTIYSESAWAAGESFVEKGNWATYFMYTLEEIWVQVQQFDVPSTGAVIESALLEVDGEYIIEASGTYTFLPSWNPAGIADAKYSYRKSGSAGYPYYNDSGDLAWIDGADLTGYEYYLQLQIEGSPAGWIEDYNDNNIYTVAKTGDGSTLGFSILDNGYGDNDGHLTVKIRMKVF